MSLFSLPKAHKPARRACRTGRLATCLLAKHWAPEWHQGPWREPMGRSLLMNVLMNVPVTQMLPFSAGEPPCWKQSRVELFSGYQSFSPGARRRPSLAGRGPSSLFCWRKNTALVRAWVSVQLRLLTVGPRVSDLTPLCLSPVVCKMGLTTAPTLLQLKSLPASWAPTDQMHKVAPPCLPTSTALGAPAVLLPC